MISRLAISTGLATLLLAGPALAETLTILHTNDFHSRIEPIHQNTFRHRCPRNCTRCHIC